MSKPKHPTFHALADVRSEKIGEGTKIWQFCVVLPEAQIGRDCNICSNVFIENDVVVGDRVTVKCGVQLWDGVTIEDDAFIGPNVTFTNDRYPPSDNFPQKMERTKVGKGASIGANATILPGVEIGAGAMIGAGSVVTRSVPAGELWLGNPARFLKKLSPQ
jgi:UDP-2-acetamido-3-amino-2,3-dideoxy-glucuronate N-acetyltransferase